jgi:membrane protein implicated in regulation of membrane protease activity
MSLPESYWIIWSAALVVLGLSALIGEFSILPWLSAAIASAGLADFYGASSDAQLLWFSVVLILSVIASRTVFRQSNQSDIEITQTLGDMVGAELIVRSVDKKNVERGEGLSTSGRLWSIEHVKGASLIQSETVICVSTSGISLLVDYNGKGQSNG